MTRTKLLPAAALFALLGALAGCGGSKPSGPAPNPDPQPQPEPAPAADPYELDPAKHAVPAAPATGRLAGKAFTPDRVELEGDRLTFRTGKDFFADQEVVVVLGDKAKPADGVKLVVRPAQSWADGIPMLNVAARHGKDVPDMKFVSDGYALTLELGKLEKGKAAGKIYLCLPGPDRSYLAGTFAARRKRAMSEPPGDDEVPFVQGAVSPPLAKGQGVKVGYVGLVDGKVLMDSAGTKVFEDGSGAVRSMTFTPRTAGVRVEKFTPRFDFTNLPPGRYLVFARVESGPVAWSWVDVAAGARVTKDLALDASKAGTVEVKLPAGEREASLVPADAGAPPDESFVWQLSFQLDLRAEAKDGKATIAHVPAGKYQVRAGALRADVEVAAGKTATVELKAKKE